jgi:ketosteroid isomerase-like protein
VFAPPGRERCAGAFWLRSIPEPDAPVSGLRFQMDETALFTVKDGKIVREEFFYVTG